MHIYCRTTPILKTLGQFENLVFVIISTRENIPLTTRTPFSCFLLSSAFLKNNAFNLSGIPAECQTDWIQIRPDQFVCKHDQEKTPADKE